MTLVKIDDVLDVISEYMFEQECVMDNCDTMTKVYDNAKIKWSAANQIFCNIYNKLLVHVGEEK